MDAAATAVGRHWRLDPRRDEKQAPSCRKAFKWRK